MVERMQTPGEGPGVEFASIPVESNDEIGQLAVVLVVATLLAAIRRRSDAIGYRVAYAGSVVCVSIVNDTGPTLASLRSAFAFATSRVYSGYCDVGSA